MVGTRGKRLCNLSPGDSTKSVSGGLFYLASRNATNKPLCVVASAAEAQLAADF
jgi:hypothetical protein